MDVINNPYPTRIADPNEPNVLAHFIFSDSSPPELATYGRYINRSALGGAAYDLATRINAPGIGYNGGLLGNLAPPFGSFMRCALIPVGNVNFSYTIEHVQTAVASGFTAIAVNGAAPNHSFWTSNTGHVGISFQAAVTSETPWNVAGRGLIRYDALYDGVNQILLATAY